MTIKTGSQVGPYEILASIGTGGMAEVYKARDTRLDRLVAIKVSKENFSERFEREARAVAALSHPHICTLFDVGPNYLVMEYIEGAPINGPIPFAQALNYAIQLCDALDAAHRKNIIHRDLKPGNILVTKSGVKILDFGLAKVGAAVSMDEATLTNALTGKGEILGTLNYMSPEQLQGREAGAPSDIFSFGLVLYEMLTGKRAFDGASAASVIAAILERPSPSIGDIAPPAIERMLHRCLEKDPDSRWQSARDLKTELEWIAAAPAATQASPAKPKRIGQWLGWIAAAMVGLGLGFPLSMSWRTVPELAAIMFELNPPEGESFVGMPVISPDGRSIASLIFEGTGQRRLAVRRLDTPGWHKLTGTEGASGPTWSADNRYLAFVAGSKLKKIDVTGGPPQPVTDFPTGWIPYTAWNRDGFILFSRRDGLWKVSASGGTPVQVTAHDASLQEDLHGAPQFLPDGHHFLFLGRTVQAGKGGVYAGSMDASGEKNRTFILPATSSAVFAQAPSGAGYLLFEREGALMAQPFNPEQLKLTGEPVLAAAQVGLAGSAVAVSVSRNGMMVVSSDPNTGRNTQLAWVDRTGKALGDVGPPGVYSEFSLAPDGKRLALARSDDRDLWLLDLATSGLTRFTFDPATDRFPVWSPDGTRILYARVAGRYMYEKTVSGSDERELTGVPGLPTDWSHDGHSILVRTIDGDLWTITDGKPIRITATSFNESEAQFSPDGKWIAFVSDESRRSEVYVQAFPKAGEKFPISVAGGVQPRWRADGKELFYVAPDGKLMAVAVKTGAGFERAAPNALFDLQITDAATASFDYLVDGSSPRFLIRTPAKTPKSTPVTVMTNWLAAANK